MVAFYNASLPGHVYFGVSDDGVVEGVHTSSTSRSTSSLAPLTPDLLNQHIVKILKRRTSPEMDPALANICVEFLKVDAISTSDLVVVHVYLELRQGLFPPALIRFDERDRWCWPIKVGSTIRHLTRFEAERIEDSRRGPQSSAPFLVSQLFSDTHEVAMTHNPATAAASTSASTIPSHVRPAPPDLADRLTPDVQTPSDPHSTVSETEEYANAFPRSSY